MQAVLPGAEIDGPDREPLHDRANLLQRQAIDTRCIAVAECASQVALVREAEAEREHAATCVRKAFIQGSRR